MKRNLRLLLPISASVCAAALAWAAPKEPQLAARSFALNSYVRQLDGQWQGIRVASDGNVYFASSTHAHNHGAAFFRYNPRTNALTLLCEDITRICGEDPNRTPPQGKIHSDILEADGWLYFATHLANEWSAARAAYTGGHVVGYELATGKFRDLGVVRPNYSIYSGIGLDSKRGWLYVFVTPFAAAEQAKGGSHLYRVDLRSGEKKDLGLLKSGGYHASSYFFVDRRGDCWFTVASLQPNAPGGTLYCARAATGKIDRFEDALPPRYSVAQDVVAPGQSDRSWSWAQPLPGGDRCVFTLSGCGRLWLFDATKAGSSEAFRGVSHIGYNYLGMAVSGDRVYYVQRANRRPGNNGDDQHLLSASLDPAGKSPIIDHGLIVDQDGRRPWRLPGLAVDTDGRAYMIGDWHLLPGEKGTLRHTFKGGQHTYEELPRGEFFAVARLTTE